jgi:hypothetical protein
MGTFFNLTPGPPQFHKVEPYDISSLWQKFNHGVLKLISSTTVLVNLLRAEFVTAEVLWVPRSAEPLEAPVRCRRS